MVFDDGNKFYKYISTTKKMGALKVDMYADELSDVDTYLKMAGERHELMYACAANEKHNEVWNGNCKS